MNPKDVVDCLLTSYNKPESEPNRKLSDCLILIEQGLGDTTEATVLKEWCINFWGRHSQEVLNLERMERFQKFKRSRKPAEGTDEKASP
jgi:hypothetical protein